MLSSSPVEDSAKWNGSHSFNQGHNYLALFAFQWVMSISGWGDILQGYSFLKCFVQSLKLNISWASHIFGFRKWPNTVKIWKEKGSNHIQQNSKPSKRRCIPGREKKQYETLVTCNFRICSDVWKGDKFGYQKKRKEKLVYLNIELNATLHSMLEIRVIK